jgi:hypothetical protein
MELTISIHLSSCGKHHPNYLQRVLLLDCSVHYCFIVLLTVQFNSCFIGLLLWFKSYLSLLCCYLDRIRFINFF